MGTFLELFRLLDDWDPETLPERVTVNPDETLASIRKHLAEGNVPEAQRIISEEISRLRPMVRAVLLDAVDLVQEKGNTPFHLLQYLSYLHRRAAQILLSEQRWDEARQHILKAVVLAPDDDDPRYVLVEIYEHASQYDAALRLLESLVTGYPDRCLPLFELALSIHQQGALSAAATCYQRVKELDDVGAFRDLADIHLGALEMPLADIEMLEHVSEEGSKAALARDYESALTSFQHVLAWSPKHSQTWVRVGYLYQRRASGELDLVKGAQAVPVFKVANEQQQNDLRRAAQAYRIAILAEPGLAEAEVHHWLAECYLSLDLAALALEPAQTAVKLAPNDVDILVTLGNAFLANDALVDAESTLRAVLSFDPQNLTAHLVLARTLERAGRPNEAIVHWRVLEEFFSKLLKPGGDGDE